jgi:hypothetical protein
MPTNVIVPENPTLLVDIVVRHCSANFDVLHPQNSHESLAPFKKFSLSFACLR